MKKQLMQEAMELQRLFPSVFPEYQRQARPLYPDSKSIETQNYRHYTYGAYVFVASRWLDPINKLFSIHPPDVKTAPFRVWKNYNIPYDTNDYDTLFASIKQDISESSIFPVDIPGVVWYNHQQWLTFNPENGKPAIPIDEVFVNWFAVGEEPKPISKFVNAVTPDEDAELSFAWKPLFTTPTPEIKAELEARQRDELRSRAQFETANSVRELSEQMKQGNIPSDSNAIDRLAASIERLLDNLPKPEADKKGK